MFACSKDTENSIIESSSTVSSTQNLESSSNSSAAVSNNVSKTISNTISNTSEAESSTPVTEEPQYSFQERSTDKYYNVLLRILQENGTFYTYYGLADEKKNIIIPPEYISNVQVITDNRFYAKYTTIAFLINDKNEVLYEANYIDFNLDTRIGNSSIYNELTHKYRSYLIDENGEILDDSWDSLCMNDNGFYATKCEKLYELDGYGKLIGEYDTSPKIIDSSNEKIDIMVQGSPLELFLMYGAADKEGNIIVPLKYNNEPIMISDNRIFVDSHYGTFDSEVNVIYDLDGNILCEGYEDLQFYTDYNVEKENRIYSEYGVAGDLIDDYNIVFDYYLIDKNGDVICELPYSNCYFLDMDTLCVQDSEESEKYYVEIVDLIV